MKKVLFIAYYFPPIGGGGVSRPLNFFNYLPEYNWIPSVLTVRNGGFWVMDNSREDKITNKNNVHRTFALTAFEILNFLKKKDLSEARDANKVSWYRKLANMFLIPDLYIGWYPFALKKGINLLRKQKFDIIFATSPPPTTLLIGYRLSKLFNIPFVADFRDLWVNGYFHAPPTGLHHYLHSYLESKVVKHASLVIFGSDNMRSFVAKRYENKVNIEKFKTLSNGFDLKDFSEMQTMKNSNTGSVPIKIVHTGNLTITRSIDSLVKAISQLIKEKKIEEKDIEIKLVGRRDDINDKLIRKYNLCNVFKLQDSVSHKESIYLQQNADVLLLIGNKLKGNLNYIVLTGKIYEYLAANKPIFAIVPKGSEACKLVERAKAGVSADIYDINDIKEKLFSLITNFRNNNLTFRPDTSYIENFEYKNLTHKLALLFDECIQERLKSSVTNP